MLWKKIRQRIGGRIPCYAYLKLQESGGGSVPMINDKSIHNFFSRGVDYL